MRLRWLLPIGLLLLLCLLLVSLALGSASIPLSTVVNCLLAGLGATPKEGLDPALYSAICMIRLPRVLVGLLAGAALGISGATMQGIFRNPLADPGILGVSSGSGLGALVATTTGLSTLLGLPLVAFLGALLAVGLILLVARGTGGTGNTLTLVMAGMAIGALFGALTSLLLTYSNQYQVSSYIFWTMGSLANRRWEHLYTLLVPVLVPLILLCLFSPQLNILLLGDEQAQALGLRPARTRTFFLMLATLCTASVVAITGPIGFVGLMVPHIVRILFGPDHRRLLPLSAIGGAMLLLGCDMAVRLLGQSQGRELSVGILTALLGAPFFLYLLLRAYRKGGAPLV